MWKLAVVATYLHSYQILGSQATGNRASLLAGAWFGEDCPGNNPACPHPFQALEPQAYSKQDQAWSPISIHPLIYFNYSLPYPHLEVPRLCLGASGSLIHRAHFEGARTQLSGRAGLWGPSSGTFDFEHVPTRRQSWTKEGLNWVCACLLLSRSPPHPLFFLHPSSSSPQWILGIWHSDYSYLPQAF